MVVKNAAAVCVVAGLSAVAFARRGAIHAVAHDEAMMRVEGERCEGAQGYEFVEWVPCADGLVCIEAPELGWGKFCKVMTYRGEGERCMGEEGYEAVPWIPCAEGLACEDMPEMGWGKFCVPAPPAEETPTRGEGERCMGADGEETIDWIPCADGLECIEEPNMGWGKFCLSPVPVSDLPVYPPGGGMPSAPTEAPMEAPMDPQTDAETDMATDSPADAPAGSPADVPTTADNHPLVITIAGEKCAENWQTCGGRGPEDVERPCCDENYTCVVPEEEGYRGLRCEPKKA